MKKRGKGKRKGKKRKEKNRKDKKRERKITEIRPSFRQIVAWILIPTAPYRGNIRA